MSIFVARHAETVEGKDGIIQGSLPGRLTERGKQEARDLGLKLRRHGSFERIVSSDLSRAKETAEILSTELSHCPILYDCRLRERSFGSLEGQPVFRLKRMLVEQKADLRSVRIPGAEDVLEFEQRVKQCFMQWTASGANRHLVLVTHAGVIAVILRACLDAPAEEAATASAFEVAIQGDRRLFVRWVL